MGCGKCMTKEDVLKIVREKDVSFIQFWFTDVLGVLKTFAITPSELENGMTESDFEATRAFLSKFVSLLTDGQSRQLGYEMDSQYYQIDNFADYVRDGLAKLSLEDVNRVIRENLSTEDIQYVFVSRDAADLREQVAILERSSQIDRQAAESIKSELGKLEEDLQAAREEVEFYRGIVSPGDVKPGLRIHRFTLEEGATPHQFHYELVLTQLKRNDKIVNGVVDWRISGAMPEYQAEIGLERVTDPAVKVLKFRFRYFQELTGTITLPEDFTPSEVVLTIKPSGKGKGKTEPVVQSFDWVATRS